MVAKSCYVLFEFFILFALVAIELTTMIVEARNIPRLKEIIIFEIFGF